MNAVEIEEAVSALAAAPFDPAKFPFAFLQAFGNKDATITRLKAGKYNASDVPGGLLQRNNIHLAVAESGQVAETLAALRASPKTAAAKAKFILATDGEWVEAEDLVSGDPLACRYAELGEKFGFFLALAGISTVAEIKNNPIDVKATSRLNKLYVELLKENPDWATPEKRPRFNQLMAQLIFCFFAEDTGIFLPHLFTRTIEQMSDSQAGNTADVLLELFRAMATPIKDRAAGNFRPWAEAFPYVNGGLFTDVHEVPRFSRIARTYLIRAGELDWQAINPDIFGSMIQAVADDEERGDLGMHYTSVPNILKVLNPLFLDDLRGQLEAAGDNPRKLGNLRRRIAQIRVFDPACGSGNFLVIAYREMRAIEAEIVRRTRDDPKSRIKLSNFYGIEIKSFAAEIARLALLIAEFQADCQYLSQAEARSMVLPLHKTGQVVTGNALRLDWLEVCPPATKAVVEEYDLAGPTGRLALEDNGLGERAEPETFICGNPPYLGSKWQSEEQKSDLSRVFESRAKNWKSLDYVAGWFMKATDYGSHSRLTAAFVSTNSICQGQQVPILWPQIFETGHEIAFSYTSFKWANLASHNAGVTVVIVGISNHPGKIRRLFSIGDGGSTIMREIENINAYLVAAPNIEVEGASRPISGLATMQFGNHPYYGGALIFSTVDAERMRSADPRAGLFIRPLYGSQEFISAAPRACLWITSDEAAEAETIPSIAERLEAVVTARRAAIQDKAAQKLAETPYRFRDQENAGDHVLIVPRVSSENRPYLPVGLLEADAIIQDQAFALYDAPLWNMAIIASRLHLVWIATVCGKLETRYRYSNTLGWNTFPVPTLTEQMKQDLTRTAEAILLAREAHFPATIADLYDPDSMPDGLRRAHDENDEVLERIYIGRRFRNDTERLEKLFDLYTKMTADKVPPKNGKRAAA